MPTTNSYVCGNDNGLITPAVWTAIERNPFDNAFSHELDATNFDDWMKWDCGVPEQQPTAIIRTRSIASNISPEGWPTDPGSVEASTPSTSYSQNLFSDAPFELEDASVPSTALPLQPIRTPSSYQTKTPHDVRRSFQGFSSLSEAEERDLQDIAMPCRALSDIKIASEPSSPSLSLSPDPEPQQLKNKNKRKFFQGDMPNSLVQSRKRGHNMIEKRYRTNLNEKINCLREGIPCLTRQPSKDGDSDGEESEGEPMEVDSKILQQKYGKAAILTRALEYIKHLEHTTQRLGSEVDSLNTRVTAFEKLAIGGSSMINANGMLPVERPALVKSETLESIQAVFQQIRPKCIPASSPSARKRRGSRTAKGKMS